MLAIDTLILDTDERVVRVAGKNLSLSPMLFRVLEALMWCEKTLVTRHMMYVYVYGTFPPENIYECRSIDIKVSAVRRRLAEVYGGLNLIDFVRNEGYVLRVPRTIIQPFALAA